MGLFFGKNSIVAAAADANAYFDDYMTQSPEGATVDTSYSLRTQEQVESLRQGADTRTNYDATEDAAEHSIPSGNLNAQPIEFGFSASVTSGRAMMY